MPNTEPDTTALRRCEHCGSQVRMLVARTLSKVKSESAQTDHGQDIDWDAGDVYQLLECPACDGIVLQRFYYHSHIAPEGDDLTVLYPTTTSVPEGLPPSIEQAYQSALKVRSIDPNAFGVLLGRVLELVCEERGAKGRNLDKRLQFLAKEGVIPRNLADVAHGLRHLRNVGAHPALGELTTSRATNSR
jgi:hypothetical protein